MAGWPTQHIHIDIGWQYQLCLYLSYYYVPLLRERGRYVCNIFYDYHILYEDSINKLEYVHVVGLSSPTIGIKYIGQPSNLHRKSWLS